MVDIALHGHACIVHVYTCLVLVVFGVIKWNIVTYIPLNNVYYYYAVITKALL